MTTRLETVKLDHNRDGVVDEIRLTTFDFIGDKLNMKVEQTTDTATGATSVKETYYHYDGNKVFETYVLDPEGDGQFTDGGYLDRTLDSSGRTTNEVTYSPDMNGDGMPGDYEIRIAYSYNSGGQLTGKNQDFITYGSQAPSDYLDETWAYDSKGRLVEYYIDDPNFYDCEITKFYTYDKNGRLQNIKEQNEIRYGDDRPRIDESYTYNKDGSLKTRTDWADHSDHGWFQRVDTAYTWKKGYDVQKVTYDREGDFKPEAFKLVENWYNSSGQLTHTLVSHDPDGNGGKLKGGFDSRDFFVKTWNGDTLVAEVHDYGADGIIEYQFTSELLVA